jgi:hypothetical protein
MAWDRIQARLLFGHGRVHEPHYFPENRCINTKKHPWPDLPIPQLAADFF